MLYKAYNDTAWWGFLSNLPKDHKPEVRILKNKNYLILNVMGNYIFKCKSYIYLKNDLNKLNRVKKNYIFNYKKYFTISKVVSKCK